MAGIRTEEIVRIILLFVIAIFFLIFPSYGSPCTEIPQIHSRNQDSAYRGIIVITNSPYI